MHYGGRIPHNSSRKGVEGEIFGTIVLAHCVSKKVIQMRKIGTVREQEEDRWNSCLNTTGRVKLQMSLDYQIMGDIL